MRKIFGGIEGRNERIPTHPKHQSICTQAGRRRDQEKRLVAVLEMRNTNSALEMEYEGLRNLILKRIDSRDRVMQINTTIVAGILALITVKDFSSNLVLIYPPISTMFAAIWARNEYSLQLIYLYIRTHLEPKIPDLRYDTWRWEQRLRPKDSTSIWFLVYILKSEFSLFLFLQIITIAIGIYTIGEKHFTYFDQILLILDCFSVIVLLSIGYFTQTKFREAMLKEEKIKNKI